MNLFTCNFSIDQKRLHQVSLKLSLLFVAYLFAVIGLQAQSNNNGFDIEFVKSVVWKSGVELNATLVEEKNRFNTELAQPNMAPSDRSLFMACNLLVGYVQADIQANVATSDAIIQNYEKVLSEMQKNSSFDAIQPGSLEVYLPVLVEKMTAAVQPTAVSPN